MKPFSESCEQNKDVILSVIKPLLSATTRLLEIGSGTGQHAVYFGNAMPHIQWHTSDCKESLSGIQMWLDDAAANNINISFNNMKNAVIYGSNLASFCVERFGTERMINLEQEEVQNRLQEFKQLTQFDIELN